MQCGFSCIVVFFWGKAEREPLRVLLRSGGTRFNLYAAHPFPSTWRLIVCPIASQYHHPVRRRRSWRRRMRIAWGSTTRNSLITRQDLIKCLYLLFQDQKRDLLSLLLWILLSCCGMVARIETKRGGISIGGIEIEFQVQCNQCLRLFMGTQSGEIYGKLY